jgi:hypothetical protein
MNSFWVYDHGCSSLTHRTEPAFRLILRSSRFDSFNNPFHYFCSDMRQSTKHESRVRRASISLVACCRGRRLCTTLLAKKAHEKRRTAKLLISQKVPFPRFRARGTLSFQSRTLFYMNRTQLAKTSSLSDWAEKYKFRWRSEENPDKMRAFPFLQSRT